MDQTVGADHVVGSNNLRWIHNFIARVFAGQVEVLVFTEGSVPTRSGIVWPLIRGYTLGDNVEHEKGLKRLQVTRFEQEPLEFRVQLTLQSFISRREDGDVVFADGLLKGLEKQSLLDELGQLGVMRVEKGDEDGIGVYLGGGVGFGRKGFWVVRQCSGGEWKESEDEEEDGGATIDGRIHGAHRDKITAKLNWVAGEMSYMLCSGLFGCLVEETGHMEKLKAEGFW